MLQNLDKVCVSRKRLPSVVSPAANSNSNCKESDLVIEFDYWRAKDFMIENYVDGESLQSVLDVLLTID